MFTLDFTLQTFHHHLCGASWPGPCASGGGYDDVLMTDGQTRRGLMSRNS